MKEIYIIDVDDLCISRITARDEKINAIANVINNTLDDKDVFTLGCSNKDNFIEELKNIIMDLENK